MIHFVPLLQALKHPWLTKEEGLHKNESLQNSKLKTYMESRKARKAFQVKCQCVHLLAAFALAPPMTIGTKST